MSNARDSILAGVAAVAGAAVLVLWPAGEVIYPGADGPVVVPPDGGGLPDDGEAGPDDGAPGSGDESDGAGETPVDPPEDPPLLDEAGAEFSYDPPGELSELDHRIGEIVPGFSGVGWQGTDALSQNYVFAPDIGWPMAERGFPNSQYFRPGGAEGPPGECSAVNYEYPWQDNFCETRWGRTNQYCEGGDGHQGQDIRPASCTAGQPKTHKAVAVADGYISGIASMTVKLRDEESGRTYWYMHLQHWDSCASPATLTQAQCNSGGIPLICSGDALDVEVGDTVSKGDPIGNVSDWFGLTWWQGQCRFSATTDHLHFEIWDTVSPDGTSAGATRVPPYSSLVVSYLRKLGEEEDDLPDWDEAEF
ncbi:MAG: M23 family metallopeptidase [Oceanicaulis sp.]